MRLQTNDIELIGLAALLHDIGKIAIPLEILTKPGALSVPEMQLVQRHSRRGYQILRTCGFPSSVAEMVLQHHECLDGSGYPQGLRADEVLLGTKIIACADVVDSMREDRCYRHKLPSQEIVAELSQGRGRLYDPAVVDACLFVLGVE
jgi:putative nucleotidyltransferase with HDIG domain